ncbi:Homeodomain-like protein, partial [Bombardia bombarda]
QQKTLKDPILFPTTGVAPSNVGPLFVSNAESLEKMQDRVVDEHMASRPADFFRETSPPKREDYTLALWFKSNTVKMFSENPRGWLQKERELLRQDRKHAAVGHSLQKIIYPAPSKPSAPRQQVVRNTTSRVQKPPKAPKIKSSTVERFIRATTAPRSTARHSPMTTPEPRARTVAPNREDKDFNSLEDLSPPLYTLPSKPNSLKVDWKGNPLDLSKDPHASLLHPDELLLAAGLRLDCATYLTSKRRIFIRRRECAQIGKEFRKTDAQQACKIDVNKASKLWTAYDRVGWLDMKYIKMHM